MVSTLCDQGNCAGGTLRMLWWGWGLSLAGAATSIIFVTTKGFVATNTCLLRQNTSFVATKRFCYEKYNFVTTNVLAQQAYFYCGKRPVLS